ncbi:MAG: S41 family peptidase [Phototrophicales bacterium]|nr:S41 family peptidase [Phototrophicales bacterium]
MWRKRIVSLMFIFLFTGQIFAQENIPPAPITNDEGGTVVIRGTLSYSNPFFTGGVAMPVIILEDQAGFVDRDRFFVMSMQSQTLAQITSDFYTSPFTYSLALPIEPQGEYRDVNFNGIEERGVQVFAVAYWENVWGDPFLEERDLGGGGWSTAYATTRVSTNPDDQGEIVGGAFVVYSPDDTQAFPSDFGSDGKLFTEDDPLVILPQGYTVVNLETSPFTFDRSREADLNLLEPQGAELVDFSDLSYTDAFDAMVDLMRREYSFTAYKNINWDDLYTTFYPRFEEAERRNNREAYLFALRDFLWQIPDGHVGGTVRSLITYYWQETEGGIGVAIRETDDGRVLVNYVTPNSPADRTGIQLGAEIISVNNILIREAIFAVIPWTGPFSTTHNRRLEQLRYVLRFPIGEQVTLVYRDLNEVDTTTVDLMTVFESDSLDFSYYDTRGIEPPSGNLNLPVEYRQLENGYVYVKIYGFFDNNLLSIQLWERMMRYLNENGVQGVIIDMRENGGGWGWLANAMASYFFTDPYPLGRSARYNPDLGEFYSPPGGESRLLLPADELRYAGPVAVLIGPGCASACETFSWAMSMKNRAAIVGQYPTMGLGGGVNDFIMPEAETIRFTVTRGLGPNGEINIEGRGVIPSIRVPVNEQTLFTENDVILDEAVNWLVTSSEVDNVEMGDILADEKIEGTLQVNTRLYYNFTPLVDGDYSIRVYNPDSLLDTVVTIFDGRNSLAFNDDIALGDFNSTIEAVQLDANVTYTIEVMGFNDRDSGDFILNITLTP